MNQYNPKNILVTGGAGFIGSHYVDLILDTDPQAHIVNLDALTYAGKMENLVTAQQNPRHHFIHGNICDKELVRQLLRQYQIDTIVHFAAESHVDRSISGPEIFIETNVLGTQYLLEEARKFWQEEKKWDASHCRFHMISTDEVYGSLSLTDPAFTEENNYQPNSPYSASKAAADHLVRAYTHTYHLPTTLSNCSNNYGMRQDKEKLIPTVIQACLQGKPIPVYGNGLNQRDWIHVLDHCHMVDWVVRFGKIGEKYNLGAQNEWSNIDLIHVICAIFDKFKPQAAPHKALIQYIPDRAGHDFRYAINSSKAHSEGCPMPRYQLEETLATMILKQMDINLS